MGKFDNQNCLYIWEFLSFVSPIKHPYCCIKPAATWWPTTTPATNLSPPCPVIVAPWCQAVWVKEVYSWPWISLISCISSSVKVRWWGSRSHSMSWEADPWADFVLDGLSSRVKPWVRSSKSCHRYEQHSFKNKSWWTSCKCTTKDNNSEWLAIKHSNF